jgi:small subunit ribosomal protein S13
MPRILGVDIPNNKKVEYSLRYIYGIGPLRAMKICQILGFRPEMRASELSEEQLNKIVDFIVREGWKCEGDLRREITQDLKRLQAIKSYRGLRHFRGLPVRGQRTRTNARTRKGKRKTVGVASAAVPAKAA